MHKIPDSLTTQCICCNQGLGSKIQRQYSHALKIKKNITPALQLKIYNDKQILVKQNSHYSCNDCYDIICDSDKFEIKSKTITNDNIEYAMAAYNQIVQALQNQLNLPKNESKVSVHTMTNEQIKDMCGLNKQQIETIETETGNQYIIFLCFKQM